MLYAHITNGEIDQVGELPRLWFDGARWHDWRGDTPDTIPADFGWKPVTLSERPLDTDQVGWTAEYELVNGEPVQTWVARLWTTAELVSRAQLIVRQTLTTDTQADIPKIQAATDDLVRLLGDATTPGSIRQWRSGVSNSYSAANERAMADLMIQLAQDVKAISRQVKRLAQQQVGDYSSADVGPE